MTDQSPDFPRLEAIRSDLPVNIRLANGRTLHFPRILGFCSGVRNAVNMVERAAAAASPGRIWLLGEMIHNPVVHQQFAEKGIRLLPDAEISAWLAHAEHGCGTFVIPAFGLPLEQDAQLRRLVRSPEQLIDTTCPFVRRVWQAVEQAGKQQAALFIHGKTGHPESEAILSRAKACCPYAKILSSTEEASQWLRSGDPDIPWKLPWRLVNQTTMLEEETRKIADILRQASRHAMPFQACTTLCPSTKFRQASARELCLQNCDRMLILGGVTSSNTTELYRIASNHIGEDNCLFLENAQSLQNDGIRHYLPSQRQWRLSPPAALQVPHIGLLSGASCPDTVIQDVLRSLAQLPPL